MKLHETLKVDELTANLLVKICNKPFISFDELSTNLDKMVVACSLDTLVKRGLIEDSIDNFLSSVEADYIVDFATNPKNEYEILLYSIMDKFGVLGMEYGECVVTKNNARINLNTRFMGIRRFEVTSKGLIRLTVYKLDERLKESWSKEAVKIVESKKPYVEYYDLKSNNDTIEYIFQSMKAIKE